LGGQGTLGTNRVSLIDAVAIRERALSL
jgi:hypothetical protein